MTHGSCAHCGRTFRSKKAKERAVNFLKVHADLAQSAGIPWPLTKRDRHVVRSQHFKQHGEVATA